MSTHSATGEQIAVILTRAVDDDLRKIPEVELWFSVIEQALKDADDDEPGAREFIRSKRFSGLVSMLGLDPDWVKRLIREFSFWGLNGMIRTLEAGRANELRA